MAGQSVDDAVSIAFADGAVLAFWARTGSTYLSPRGHGSHQTPLVRPCNG
jgi:hypothetical protein